MDERKENIQRIQTYIEALKKDDLPTTPEEWQKMIECLEESTHMTAEFFDQIVAFEDTAQELEDMKNEIEDIRKNGDINEHRMQLYEDHGERAIDFIIEQGLYEQFRRYYEKKKQTNILAFPMDH